MNFIGAEIPIGDIQSFDLTSVFTTESTAQNVTNYFTLYEPNPLAPKEYNIKVTSDFLQNVYYGSDAGKRVWNFNFTSVVNGTTSTISKNVSLKNLRPVIYVDIYTPAVDFTIDADPTQTEVTTLEATNGASVVNQENPNTGEELTWSIVSQINANGDEVDYFGFNTSYIPATPAGGSLSDFNLTNSLPGEIPSSVYTVVVQVTDANAATDQINITVNMGLLILPGQVTAREAFFAPNFSDAEFMTFIRVTESDNPDYNGLYLCDEDWNSIGGAGGLVDIDYTGAININSGSCPNLITSPRPYWFFSPNPGTTLDDMMYYAINCGVYGTIDYVDGVVDYNPDTSINAFRIV